MDMSRSVWPPEKMSTQKSPRSPRKRPSAGLRRLQFGASSFIATIAGFAVAAVSLAGDAARAPNLAQIRSTMSGNFASVEPQQAVGSAKPPEAAIPLTYTFNSGDRVKIAIYGREDLPGEYRVNATGQLAIPTVGVFDVLTMTPQQLEVVVRDEVQRLGITTAFVSVEPMEPVFVTGQVNKPGAYPYSSGMIAIQAATLAGGMLTATTTSYLSTEAIRERARMQSAEFELVGLIARRARLSAERAGLAEIALPELLVKLMGEKRAGEVISREQSILEQDLQAHARQRESHEIAIKEAKVEIAAYEEEITYIRQQRGLRKAIVDPLQVLANKGLTTKQRAMESELMLVSIERDAQSAIANLSRARQALDRSERDLALLEINRAAEIDKELQTIEEQVAKAQANRSGSATFVDFVRAMPAEHVPAEEAPIVFEIIRKTKMGDFKTMIASELTSLMPGDVLRISMTGSK
jgi:protein involved in polysaccharide export with SLBB domain